MGRGIFVAPYWSRASFDVAVAFGWSFRGQEEADSHALARATRMAERLRLIESTSHESWNTPAFLTKWLAMTPEGVRDQIEEFGDFAWDYYGGSRPIREPILETYGDAEEPWALITRNRYGARVLNTASAMFVDIDLPPPPPKPYDPRTFWERWVTRVPPPEPTPPTPPAELVERARAVVAASPGMGMRMYRTSNGFRGLVTHQPYVPGSDEAETLLEAFGSDPLYRQLCRAQRCFRARLTPKPWRAGYTSPPINWFPYQEEAAKRVEFQSWLSGYEDVSRNFVATEVLEHFGEAEVHPEVAPVLELHDKEALGEGLLA